MDKTTYVYTTYILATAQRTWDALTVGELTRQYWGGLMNVSDWKPGSPWEHRNPEQPGQVLVLGQVVECDPPRRLVMTWADPAEAGSPGKHSRVTFELEPVGDMVRLRVTHDELEAGSVMAGKISDGWPQVLSSLKSWLETGRALAIFCTQKREARQPVG